MKYHETTMEEYLLESERVNLHPKLEAVYDNLPDNISNLGNIIFYGPSGTGKYTQALRVIKKYSKTSLKYEKKMSITSNKITSLFKLSDIHFEVDMDTLGCTAKAFWFDIFSHISDILSTRPRTSARGIILCKNFHNIHSDLLENFYSYMQKSVTCSYKVIFVLLTEQLSFIPDNILNCCHIIRTARPTKTSYTQCVQTPKLCIKKKYLSQIVPSKVMNIKELKDILYEKTVSEGELNTNTINISEYHEKICDKILDSMIHVDKLSFLTFRNDIYDIFIYNLNIAQCVWYIHKKLISLDYFTPDDMKHVLFHTYEFFKYYNNKYRPIYHVEKLLFYIISIMHK